MKKAFCILHIRNGAIINKGAVRKLFDQLKKLKDEKSGHKKN